MVRHHWNMGQFLSRLVTQRRCHSSTRFVMDAKLVVYSIIVMVLLSWNAPDATDNT